MAKIKLTAKNGDTITTTCVGLSQSKWNEYTIHGLSKRGQGFVSQHDGERIIVQGKHGEYPATEITNMPLP